MTDYDMQGFDDGGPSDRGFQQRKEPEEGNVKKLWIFPVNMDYIQSICGLLEVFICIVSLIGWICAVATVLGVNECSSGDIRCYSFFESMAGSCCLTFLLWWLFHVIMVTQKLSILPWRLGELIILAIFGVPYVIASIILAAISCGGGSKIAAAVFGMLASAAMGYHFYLSYQVWKNTESFAARRAKQQDMESKMELQNP